jgi:hypothetical protein
VPPYDWVNKANAGLHLLCPVYQTDKHKVLQQTPSPATPPPLQHNACEGVLAFAQNPAQCIMHIPSCNAPGEAMTHENGLSHQWEASTSTLSANPAEIKPPPAKQPCQQPLLL